MFKLKLINKPKMIKLKCGFSFPNIVLANLQEKEVIHTKEVQEIVADKTYDGLFLWCGFSLSILFSTSYSIYNFLYNFIFLASTIVGKVESGS